MAFHIWRPFSCIAARTQPVAFLDCSDTEPSTCTDCIPTRCKCHPQLSRGPPYGGASSCIRMWESNRDTSQLCQGRVLRSLLWKPLATELHEAPKQAKTGTQMKSQNWLTKSWPNWPQMLLRRKQLHQPTPTCNFYQKVMLSWFIPPLSFSSHLSWHFNTLQTVQPHSSACPPALWSREEFGGELREYQNKALTPSMSIRGLWFWKLCPSCPWIMY